MLIGKKVWYSVSRENENELTNDVWFCGVKIKTGYIILETEDLIFINNFNNSIDKEEIINDINFDCGTVASNKHDLLMSLHFDGCDIYNEDETLKEKYTRGKFVEFEENNTP